jgi:hypothetical protein
MKRLAIATIALLVLVSVASAAEPVADDFAYGMRVDPVASSAFAKMTIPAEVYRRCVRSDLSDIRVFNGKGEVVPHMLRFVSESPVEAPWREVPFFSIPEHAPPGNQGYRVYVRTDNAGTVIEVNGISAQGANNQHTIKGRAFLIDKGEGLFHLEALKLEWPPETQSLVAAVAVECSDDLIHWSKVIDRATMADIRYGDHRLIQSVIALNGLPKRYLKLVRIDPETLPIVKVFAKPRAEVPIPERVTIQIEGRAMEKSPGVFEYDTGAHFPVDRTMIVFPQINSLAMATLSTRNDPKAVWTQNGRGLFYHIEVNGLGLLSEPMAMKPVSDRYFRLEIDGSQSALGGGIPKLALKYRPHELLFLTRGERPFTVAFGSSMEMKPPADMRPLLDVLGKLNSSGIETSAAIGEILTLGGPTRLDPPNDPVPVRRIVLWTILILGVTVLAAMAFRLLRHLRTRTDTLPQ